MVTGFIKPDESKLIHLSSYGSGWMDNPDHLWSIGTPVAYCSLFQTVVCLWFLRVMQAGGLNIKDDKLSCAVIDIGRALPALFLTGY